MTYTRRNSGTCSSSTTVTIEDGIVKNIEIIGGCSGNLQGISSLVVGMPAEEVAKKLAGIRCGYKPTSCPDQISKCITEALAQENK